MTTTLRPERALHIHPVETIVTLPGRFDVHTITTLDTQIETHLGATPRVSLDGSCVEHIDRAGLTFLQELRSRVERLGGEVTLTNTSLALRLGIELSGMPGLPLERGTDLLVDLDTAA